uniref:hypothetical protein n=1 Tax=Streptomyces sp. FR1 TaxID=349971 RepID=UPI0021ABF2B1|nr:hypothetical protein [Streptomyces sp. FR1]
MSADMLTGSRLRADLVVGVAGGHLLTGTCAPAHVPELNFPTDEGHDDALAHRPAAPPGKRVLEGRPHHLNGRCHMTTDDTSTTDDTTTTIQPAAPWPNYEADHARKELAAMQMLCNGASLRTVRLRTQLSWAQVKALAEVVAEDAKTPPPRNVLRDPRPHRAARIRVVPRRPAPEPAQEPADEVPSTDTTEQLSLLPEQEAPREKSHAPVAEPEQLSLMCL